MNIWRADLVPIGRTYAMGRPPNIDRPFFAYGLFRPGQLAFFQLKDFVSKVTEPRQVAGELRLRDGLPIINPEGEGYAKGALLTFLPGRAAEAYDRISAMEPDKHYRWHEALVDGTLANVLVGRSPTKGSDLCKGGKWNGWDDPLFTVALELVEETMDVVKETLKTQAFDSDLKPLFRLQMAYLLLWSSIERYVSLRYHLGDKPMKKVNRLADESAFAKSLRRLVRESRVIYRADRPGETEVLDPNSPDKAVFYYYQVRSNIIHRGKGVYRDYELLQKSLAELLPIFREVLKAAKRDAGYSAQQPAAADGASRRR
jgi:hypothetical protein